MKKFEIKRRGDELIVEFKKQKITFIVLTIFIIFFLIVASNIIPELSHSWSQKTTTIVSIFLTLFIIAFVSLSAWDYLSAKVLKLNSVGITYRKKLFNFEKFRKFKWRDFEKFELKTIKDIDRDMKTETIYYSLNIRAKNEDIEILYSMKKVK